MLAVGNQNVVQGVLAGGDGDVQLGKVLVRKRPGDIESNLFLVNQVSLAGLVDVICIPQIIFIKRVYYLFLSDSQQK